MAHNVTDKSNVLGTGSDKEEHSTSATMQELLEQFQHTKGFQASEDFLEKAHGTLSVGSGNSHLSITSDAKSCTFDTAYAHGSCDEFENMLFKR